jgi:glyoxylase-like metal-dependent hydrolase (beta-lactamase superfamily II)
MDRHQFIHSAITGISGLALQTPLHGSPLRWLFQEPWQLKMLTKNIGIFTEKGGTILFFIAKDGIAVVDAQFPEQAFHFMEAVRSQAQQPFQLLINTHHHSDHTSGNIAFKDIVSHVLAHSNCKANMIRVAIEQKKEEEVLLPDQTFTNSWSQDFGKQTIALYHYGAAHTNGDCIVHFENADVVHMGDLIFNRRHPFADRTSGASIQNWITILEKVVRKFSKKTVFVFGHTAEGYPVHGTLEDIKASINYFSRLLNFADTEINAGASKE